MNRAPSAHTLVKIASKENATEDLRNRALDYFTSWYCTHGYNKVDLSEVKERFLPSEPYGPGRRAFLCRPSDIYSNQACAVMGFFVLNRRFINDAAKFGVKPDPDSEPLINCLIKYPPRSASDAEAKFSYVAQRAASFTPTQLASLRASRIIPIESRGGAPKYVVPNFCFLRSRDDTGHVWEKVFDFVDFGETANRFLEALGVKHRPDPTQIAHILAHEPRRIYDSLEAKEYLHLLSMLGQNIDELQRDWVLWRKLKTSPFLFGWVSVGDDQERDFQMLGRAEKIVIVDEPRLRTIFRGSRLMVAPERDECELLYAALGSPKLSSLVTQKPHFVGSAKTNAMTEKLKAAIVQRARIFLKLPEIAANVKNSSVLDDNLRVEMYDSISVERSLKFGLITATHIESVTAVVDTTADSCRLLVTEPARVNYSQVAEALNSVILRRTNRGIDLIVETILKEDLEYLRHRGFAVDRLLDKEREERRLEQTRRVPAQNGILTPVSMGQYETQTPHYPSDQASIINQLKQAIQKVRPIEGVSIVHPPTSTIVHEAPRSYCDTTEARNLLLFDKSPSWGLETFHVPLIRQQFDEMISTRSEEVAQFASLLKKLAEIYGLPMDCMHLFYDPRGRTIAFNREGSLFFNISFNR